MSGENIKIDKIQFAMKVRASNPKVTEAQVNSLWDKYETTGALPKGFEGLLSSSQNTSKSSPNSLFSNNLSSNGQSIENLIGSDFSSSSLAAQTTQAPTKEPKPQTRQEAINTREFAKIWVDNTLKQAQGSLEQYYDNNGLASMAFYFEKISEGVSAGLKKVGGNGYATTKDIINGLAATHSRTSGANAQSEIEFKNGLSECGIKYNQVGARELQEYIGKNPEFNPDDKEYKSLMKKAFGADFAKLQEDVVKKIGYKQFTAGTADIALMLGSLGAAAEVKGVATATQAAIKVFGKTAGSMVVGGANLAAWTATTGTVNNLTKAAETTNDDWKNMGIATAESFGFGAFGGLLNATVVAPVVNAVSKPTQKAANVVADSFIKETSMSGKDVMRTFLTNQVPTKVGTAVGFGTEIVGFTAYETALDVVKDICTPDGRLPEDMTAEKLATYLGEKFVGQAKMLGEIKGISSLLMMHKGGALGQKAVIDNMLNKANMLEQVNIKKMTVDGKDTYEVTMPDGKKATAESVEQVLGYCENLMGTSTKNVKSSKKVLDTGVMPKAAEAADELKANDAEPKIEIKAKPETSPSSTVGKAETKVNSLEEKAEAPKMSETPGSLILMSITEGKTPKVKLTQSAASKLSDKFGNINLKSNKNYVISEQLAGSVSIPEGTTVTVDKSVTDLSSIESIYLGGKGASLDAPHTNFGLIQAVDGTSFVNINGAEGMTVVEGKIKAAGHVGTVTIVRGNGAQVTVNSADNIIVNHGTNSALEVLQGDVKRVQINSESTKVTVANGNVDYAQFMSLGGTIETKNGIIREVELRQPTLPGQKLTAVKIENGVITDLINNPKSNSSGSLLLLSMPVGKTPKVNLSQSHLETLSNEFGEVTLNPNTNYIVSEPLISEKRRTYVPAGSTLGAADNVTDLTSLGKIFLDGQNSSVIAPHCAFGDIQTTKSSSASDIKIKGAESLILTQGNVEASGHVGSINVVNGKGVTAKIQSANKIDINHATNTTVEILDPNRGVKEVGINAEDAKVTVGGDIGSVQFMFLGGTVESKNGIIKKTKLIQPTMPGDVLTAVKIENGVTTDLTKVKSPEKPNKSGNAGSLLLLNIHTTSGVPKTSVVEGQVKPIPSPLKLEETGLKASSDLKKFSLGEKIDNKLGIGTGKQVFFNNSSVSVQGKVLKNIGKITEYLENNTVETIKEELGNYEVTFKSGECLNLFTPKDLKTNIYSPQKIITFKNADGTIINLEAYNSSAAQKQIDYLMRAVEAKSDNLQKNSPNKTIIKSKPDETNMAVEQNLRAQTKEFKKNQQALISKMKKVKDTSPSPYFRLFPERYYKKANIEKILNNITPDNVEVANRLVDLNIYPDYLSAILSNVNKENSAWVNKITSKELYNKLQITDEQLLKFVGLEPKYQSQLSNNLNDKDLLSPSLSWSLAHITPENKTLALELKNRMLNGGRFSHWDAAEVLEATDKNNVGQTIKNLSDVELPPADYILSLPYITPQNKHIAIKLKEAGFIERELVLRATNENNIGIVDDFINIKNAGTERLIDDIRAFPTILKASSMDKNGKISVDLKKLNIKEKLKIVHDTSNLEEINTLNSYFKSKGVDLGQINQSVLKNIRETVRPINVPQQKIAEFFAGFNSTKFDNTIVNANLDKYAKAGIPLKYSREDFVNTLNNKLSILSKEEQNQVAKYFSFGLAEGKIKEFPRDNIQQPSFSPEINKTIEDIRPDIKMFTENNKVVMPENPEMEKSLNEIIDAFPEFTSIIGKQQHATHKYTVDVHMLKVLQETIKHPEFKNLSAMDQKILKTSTLFHDISKEEGVVDSEHFIESALYTRNIIEKLGLPAEVNSRVYNFINNHHWLEQLTNDKTAPETVAVIFRHPQDFKSAKIFAEADLKGVDNGGDFFKQYSPALKSPKIERVEQVLNEMYSTGIPMLQTKLPINQNKLPKTEYNGVEYKLIDLNKNVNLENIGFEAGTTKNNLALLTHFIPDDPYSLNIVHALTDETTEGCLSTTLMNLKNNSTYNDRKFGLIIDATNNNVAAAYKDNIGSGYRKDFNEFAKESTSNNYSRKYFSDLMKKQLLLGDSEYAELFKTISPCKKITEITELKINGKKIEAEKIQSAIRKSMDKLMESGGKEHNEIVVYNPQVKGLICKVKTMNDVPQYMLDFAKKHDLPIVLIGN